MAVKIGIGSAGPKQMRSSRPRRFLAILASIFAFLGSWARSSIDRTTAEGDWPVGQPVPIAVVDGSCRFVVPSPSPGSRTLVVVSALTPCPGSYPIRIDARPAGHAGPPILAGSSPGRPPDPSSRPTLPLPDPPPDPPRPERTFFLQDRDGDPSSSSNYRQIHACLRAFGPRIQVFVDEQDVEAVDPETLADVVSTFEDHVLPVAREQIGVASDVDGDGRFSVLISGKLGQLAGGRLSVDGFVRGADFEANMAAPLGNRCDMMYLNAALKSGPHLRTVLAHEYTHAGTSIAARSCSTRGSDEEGWLDEALAHLTEDLHHFSRTNIDHRVDAFLASPERYRVVVADYASAGLIRSHGHRGSTYLFLKWCVDRHGTGLIGSLARSQLRGVANLEAATGSSFADLFRGWSVSLFLDRIRGTTGHPSPAFGPRFLTITAGGKPDRWTADATTAALRDHRAFQLGCRLRGSHRPSGR